ncbi:MAG: hypothetical protein ACYCQI_08345 [Gammaproteobacteria bacterium]
MDIKIKNKEQEKTFLNLYDQFLVLFSLNDILKKKIKYSAKIVYYLTCLYEPKGVFMKGISSLNRVFIIFCLLAANNLVFATTHMKNQMWTCQTNASSSSNAADQKADDEMSKKARSAKDAFSFALKHCRDCTKITCDVSNK